MEALAVSDSSATDGCHNDIFCFLEVCLDVEGALFKKRRRINGLVNHSNDVLNNCVMTVCKLTSRHWTGSLHKLLIKLWKNVNVAPSVFASDFKNYLLINSEHLFFRCLTNLKDAQEY